MAIDFEAEGLLDGIEDPDARRARVELLERLSDDGIPLEELKSAAQEDRLALLPVERVLAPEAGELSVNQIAEQSGLDVDYLEALWRALGLPLIGRDEPAYSDEDLEAARTAKFYLDAGLAPEQVLEVTRVLGRSMSTLVAAFSDLIRDSLFRPGDNELDVALRLAHAAKDLAPQLDPLLSYVLNLHRREQVRQNVVSAADLAPGGLPGTRPIVVCFADLVGFTRLGEQVPPDELSAVAGRLEQLAGNVVEPPVTLVKTIGDAVMLVSPEADPALETTLGLLEAVEAEGHDFPEIRCGLAAGDALRRAGDWYGRPVNVASRVTSHARRSSILATGEVRDAAEGEYRWSVAGRRRFKGVRDEVALYRVRRAEGE